MASLKYFLICPIVFLCLSCTLANRVLNSNDGSSFGDGPTAGGGVSSVKAGPKVEPRVGAGSLGAGPKAGLGTKEGVSNVWKGVDPIVNEIGVGVGVGVGVGGGYRPGFGPGGFGPRPGVGGFDDECVLGYVCSARGCNGYFCESHSFYPLTGSMDLHEVKINWAKSKPVATAQHGESELQPTKKAQNGV